MDCEVSVDALVKVSLKVKSFDLSAVAPDTTFLITKDLAFGSTFETFGLLGFGSFGSVILPAFLR